MISKFNVGLKSLFRQGLSETEFYGDLVYKLKKIIGSDNLSAQFVKIISHYKYYKIYILQENACLVLMPVTVGNSAFYFQLQARRSDLRIFDGSDLMTYLKMRGLGPDIVSAVSPTVVKLLEFFCSGIQL